jgi:superkiller protein 3
VKFVMIGTSTLALAGAGAILIGLAAKRESDTRAGRTQEIVPVRLALPATVDPAVTSPVAGPPPIEPMIGQDSEPPVLGAGETHYGKGEGFYRSGDFAAASRHLAAEVDQHPERFHPTYLLGLSLWKEGRIEDSITTLQSASLIDPASVKARVNLGRVLNDAGRFGEALAAATEAGAIDPDDSSALNVQGRALLNLGRRAEAIDSFRSAVEKDPGNAYALNNLGYALIGDGRFVEAVPNLEEAVRVRPGVGCFHNNLGMAYERTGRREEAKEEYRKAVEAGGSEAAVSNLARLEAIGGGKTTILEPGGK